MKTTCEQAYEQGKAAFQKWYGAHGPTLRDYHGAMPTNPFAEEALRRSWWAGWNQDVRYSQIAAAKAAA